MTGSTGSRQVLLIVVGLLVAGVVLCGLCGSALFALNLLGFAFGQ